MCGCTHRHALRLAERRFGESKTLLATALRLVDDKSPMVRLRLALSLGESANARAKAGLARLAARHVGADAQHAARQARQGGSCECGLSKQDGQTHRLPTEAEWEYALPQR